jgi:hypothetical protein
VAARRPTDSADIRLDACEGDWLLYGETDEARTWLEEFTEGAERPYVVGADALVDVLSVVLSAGFTVR